MPVRDSVGVCKTGERNATHFAAYACQTQPGGNVFPLADVTGTLRLAATRA
jgi:hypothetical protein